MRSSFERPPPEAMAGVLCRATDHRRFELWTLQLGRDVHGRVAEHELLGRLLDLAEAEPERLAEIARASRER